jgi:hypothetical protein
MKINWKWPATPLNGLVPWYVVAYRVIWAPLIFTGLGLTFVGVMMSDGPAAAKQWWRSMV